MSTLVFVCSDKGSPMNIKKLLDHALEDLPHTWESLAEPNADIYTVRSATPGPGEIAPDEGTLCICGPGAASSFGGTAGSFLVVGDQIVAIDKVFPNVAACTQISVEEALGRVVSALSAEARVERARARLIRTQEHCRNVHELLDEAAEIIGNPLILIDQTGRVLAVTKDATEYRSDIAAQENLGYLFLENLEHLRREKVFERASRTEGAYLSRPSDSNHQWLHAVVRIGPVEVAYLSSFSLHRNIDEHDASLVVTLARLVALQLQRTPEFGADKAASYGIFVGELLEGSISSEVILDYRLRLLGWKAHPYCRVAVVRPRAGQLSAYDAKLLTRVLAGLLRDSRWCQRGDSVVYVIGSESSDANLLLGDERLEEALRSCDAVMGLSGPSTSLLETPALADRAARSLRTGEALDYEHRVHLWEDNALFCALLAAGGQVPPMSLCMAEVARLYASGERGHEMLRTLAAYLNCGCNPQKAADKLFVHKNTVVYRIKKLKETHGIDLEDGETRFRAALSLKVLRLIDADGVGPAVS